MLSGFSREQHENWQASHHQTIHSRIQIRYLSSRLPTNWLSALCDYRTVGPNLESGTYPFLEHFSNVPRSASSVSNTRRTYPLSSWDILHLVGTVKLRGIAGWGGCFQTRRTMLIKHCIFLPTSLRNRIDSFVSQLKLSRLEHLALLRQGLPVHGKRPAFAI